MIDKVKIEPKVITIHEGRASFYRPELVYRTDKLGREIKVDPKTGKPVKPRCSNTWLIDPSSQQGAATIKEIKEEAARLLDHRFEGRANWPKDNEITGTKGVLLCFGEGNKLPKVYDGYKDMFFIKVSDTTLPIIGDRRGRQVIFVPGDNAWHVVDRATGQTTEEVVSPEHVPYAGGYCRGRISLYTYSNEASGVNANFRSIQYLRAGDAFGGGGRRSAADELEQMAGDAPASAPAGFDDDIPF